MKIGPNKKAKLSYRLEIKDSGILIEDVKDEQPAEFHFGVNQLLPKFEENLAGLTNGQSFDFVLKAKDAYGQIDPYAIFDIPKDTFEVDGKTDDKMLQVGNLIPMTDNDGNKHMGKIIKVLDKVVTMDFNHQLAGKDLHFTGKVIDVSKT
jgi:FKBP-type peptidyl-prolyl cis-trans isomerase SlyD